LLLFSKTSRGVDGNLDARNLKWGAFRALSTTTKNQPQHILISPTVIITSLSKGANLSLVGRVMGHEREIFLGPFVDMIDGMS
jgi:hypothetical protein